MDPVQYTRLVYVVSSLASVGCVVSSTGSTHYCSSSGSSSSSSSKSMHQSGLISAITHADLDATMAPLGFAPATPPLTHLLLLRLLHPGRA